MTCQRGTPRVGRRMLAVLRIVKDNPGLSKGQVVRIAGDDIHRTNWYRAIVFCEKNGMIRAERDGNRYHLTVTPKGENRLSNPGVPT